MPLLAFSQTWSVNDILAERQGIEGLVRDVLHGTFDCVAKDGHRFGLSSRNGMAAFMSPTAAAAIGSQRSGDGTVNMTAAHDGLHYLEGPAVSSDLGRGNP